MRIRKARRDHPTPLFQFNTCHADPVQSAAQKKSPARRGFPERAHGASCHFTAPAGISIMYASTSVSVLTFQLELNNTFVKSRFTVACGSVQ